VIALSASVVLPESTGTLKLASRDPGVAPLIDCNFLATGRDARRMLEGVKLARAFARSPDLASLIAAELTPGDAVADDSALAAFIAGNLATYYHPSSTAPMGGPADPQAVTKIGAWRGPWRHSLLGAQIGGSSVRPLTPRLFCRYALWQLVEKPLAWSAVLALLRLKQALAQIVREADDANCDAEVLEGTGRPGSCVRLERRCGQQRRVRCLWPGIVNGIMVPSRTAAPNRSQPSSSGASLARPSGSRGS